MWSSSISAVPIFKLKLVEKGKFGIFPGNDQANNLIKMYS